MVLMDNDGNPVYPPANPELLAQQALEGIDAAAAALAAETLAEDDD